MKKNEVIKSIVMVGAAGAAGAFAAPVLVAASAAGLVSLIGAWGITSLSTIGAVATTSVVIETTEDVVTASQLGCSIAQAEISRKSDQLARLVQVDQIKTRTAAEFAAALELVKKQSQQAAN